MLNSKLVLAVEIFVFLLIVILDGAGYLPISQTIYLFPFIWISLRLQKENFDSLGFSRRGINLSRSILIGVILGIVLELFATYCTTPLISAWIGTEPDLSELQEVKGNLPLLLFFIALSWLLGGFGEEICFRGFLMSRFAGLFGEKSAAWIASLIFSSIVFGLGHTEQGLTGWIQEGLSGLFLGIIFLATGRNLVTSIVSHGVSNSVALVFIYLGAYPGIR